MLASLHVKNMALIQEAEVEFGPGLNIMTGETGAGKSIVIGAVNLALGSGNFKDYMPADADYALAELVFDTENPKATALLDREDLPRDDNLIILTRKYQGGRNVSKVNGETVPASFVRELSAELIDIHGQNEHQSLLYEKNHLTILDNFAKKEIDPLICAYHDCYHAYRDAKQALKEARQTEEGRARELDILEYEIQEIRQAALKEGEDEELESSFRVMANAQKITEALQETGMLTGAGSCGGASDEIGRAARALSGIRSYDDALEDLGSMLEDVESLMSEFNRSLDAYADSLTYDEQEMNRISDRLDLINRLKAKYGGTIGEILDSLREKEERLEQLENYEEYLNSLENAYESCRRDLSERAAELSTRRKESAKTLSEKIRRSLEDLNFLEVQFEIEFEELEEPGEDGTDRVRFMISMNPGMPLMPLKSVASGGELSRIMLAIKSVMADEDEIETLIFDEIDSGISGRTAQKVSEKMAAISRSHQVLCITHLPQIAAMADRHYLIEKKPADSRTVTKIGLLSEEESVSELARMLGGAKITEAVTENAREMKTLAKEKKNR